MMLSLMELSRDWNLVKIIEITPNGDKTDVTDEFEPDGRLEDEAFYKTIETFVKKQLGNISLDETIKKLFISLISKLTLLSDEVEQLKKEVIPKKN